MFGAWVWGLGVRIWGLGFRPRVLLSFLRVWGCHFELEILKF